MKRIGSAVILTENYAPLEKAVLKKATEIIFNFWTEIEQNMSSKTNFKPNIEPKAFKNRFQS